MASTPLTPIVSAIALTTAWQSLYTVQSPISRVGIDAAVFNNYSAGNVQFSVRLVQVGTADSLNEIITDKNIRAEGNDLAPAMIGQSVLNGGTIEAKSSINGAVSVTITATTFDS
tara:strand:- start:8951 stop:9295 length:345 start_codon:yes stop_codon:yes gene_type:complete